MEITRGTLIQTRKGDVCVVLGPLDSHKGWRCRQLNSLRLEILPEEGIEFVLDPAKVPEYVRQAERVLQPLEEETPPLCTGQVVESDRNGHRYELLGQDQGSWVARRLVPYNDSWTTYRLETREFVRLTPELQQRTRAMADTPLMTHIRMDGGRLVALSQGGVVYVWNEERGRWVALRNNPETT